MRDYARQVHPWHLICSPPTLNGSTRSALTLRSMQGWTGDALMLATSNMRELRSARRLGIPVVNLAGGLPDAHGIPRVMVDHVAAGRMAADHLLDRGLRHLAFFGWSDAAYSDQRHLGFQQRALEAGARCYRFVRSVAAESRMNWPERVADPADWVASLPRPCGIFAVHDYRAQFLVEVCEFVGLQVPRDIAVIGMDDNEIVCEHFSPTLSSVSRNSEQVGWEAMALIDRMIQGASPPTDDVLLKPDRVVARQSTDRLYCSDPLVQQAVEFVRQHIRSQLNIADIADELAVSKRTLETRFRQTAGTSPHAFITKMRVQHAQKLLQMPGPRTIEHVAAECGFGTPATAYAAFKRYTGQTPAAFRRSHANRR